MGHSHLIDPYPVPFGCRTHAADAIRKLAEQLPDTPGPLLPAMAVREWLAQHADRICGVDFYGEIQSPIAAIDPAQLDALRNSLMLGFMESEVIHTRDDCGILPDLWDTPTAEEAERMAGVAMAVLTHTVVQ